MYTFSETLFFDDTQLLECPSKIVSQYMIDVPSNIDNCNLHDMLPYFSKLVEKHCFPFYQKFLSTEKLNPYMNAVYKFLYTETFQTYSQSNKWIDLCDADGENGPTWILLYIRVAASKGGVCKIVDIPANEEYVFKPLSNKCILFPSAWTWRYRFLPVEEGIQIVDVIQIKAREKVT
jgi:hypothetical protein